MPDEPELRLDTSVFRDSLGHWQVLGTLTVDGKVICTHGSCGKSIEGNATANLWHANTELRRSHNAWMKLMLDKHLAE